MDYVKQYGGLSDGVSNATTDNGSRDGDTGWPGMMSIRVHELDGTYDHPSLPSAGDTWQLLKIQCHSKLASKCIQKPKKGSKPDGSDDNADSVQNLDMRSSMDSPLLWIRVDPDMEYFAELHFHQPIQMWINQLEKDKDVVAQAQAIAMLEKLPQLSFVVVNVLNNFLSDSKAFWRVRIEAAYALAHSASEALQRLIHVTTYYQAKPARDAIAKAKNGSRRNMPSVVDDSEVTSAASKSSDLMEGYKATELTSEEHLKVGRSLWAQY